MSVKLPIQVVLTSEELGAALALKAAEKLGFKGEVLVDASIKISITSTGEYLPVVEVKKVINK